MPNTRSSSIREIVIDKCLSGGKEMTLKEIWAEVNKELEARDEPVVRSKVTILQDLRNISLRWNAQIDENKRGMYVYYKYKDPTFSIYTPSFDTEVLVKAKELIKELECCRGLPNQDWLNDVFAYFYSIIHNERRSDPIVMFDYTPEYMQSLRHYRPLLEAIQSESAIELTYQKFNTEQPRTYVVHPYQIRQYQKRWYLVASVDHHPESLTCFAFDRIVEFKPSTVPYRENTRFDIDEYFDSMVGLTIPDGAEPQDVILWVAEREYPYLRTNPIHTSQKLVRDVEDGKIVSLHLYINRELEMRLLSHNTGITVLAPPELREKMKERVKAMAKYYEE